MTENKKWREEALKREQAYLASRCAKGDKVFMYDDPQRQINLVVWAERQQPHQGKPTTLKLYVETREDGELKTGPEDSLFDGPSFPDSKLGLLTQRDYEKKAQLSIAIMSRLMNKLGAVTDPSVHGGSRGEKNVEVFQIVTTSPEACDKAMQQVTELLTQHFKMQELPAAARTPDSKNI